MLLKSSYYLAYIVDFAMHRLNFELTVRVLGPFLMRRWQ